MEPIVEALRQLQRQAEIQNTLRRARGSLVLDERELCLIRKRLAQYPEAVQVMGRCFGQLT